MFKTPFLTEHEIENAENYPTIFLIPDSKKWDPYDELYKLNEFFYLDNKGDMIIPTIATEKTLVVGADLSVAVADFNDNNDM